ncbi:hypothetical protein D4764_0154740 [Takifugu flavidus]|uniref:Uncharacterized protein n=1 Tax=Takifugu flavidus TaxID=433684 RepID=A0A5C6MIC4_9TELE|nr:hypothetical protein D4764_0154740 [Takifugu flavidus]
MYGDPPADGRLGWRGEERRGEERMRRRRRRRRGEEKRRRREKEGEERRGRGRRERRRRGEERREERRGGEERREERRGGRGTEHRNTHKNTLYNGISSLTREKALHLFPAENPGLGFLEVLILIPAASHSAANRSSDRWRSRADDANRYTSSAKSRDLILREQRAVSAILSEDPPQDPPRDTVECLLEVHKTHVDWLGKLPCTLEDPAEGVELVNYSTPRTKPTLLLLNLREAEECDPPIVGTHPSVPLLKKRDYHPGLPIQWHRPRCPRDVAELCQPRQPYNIQSLKELRADLIHPRGLATEEFFDYLGNFSPGDMRACPQVLLPHWEARWMVVQNLFEAVRKSFSMASPNSSYATAIAALRFSCRYLSAASGFPQARSNHLAAAAPISRLNNGGTEHGPFRLNLPRDMVKALPEV